MSISKGKGLYYQEKWEELQYKFANIEMKQEIEKLQQENQNLKGTIETYDILLKSNVKGAKVIEELEKYLEEMLDSENDIFSVIRVKDVLDKLKQLQEESK